MSEGVIRIERDPAWWSAVAAHPALAPGLGTTPEAVGAVAARADVTPLAAEHGGFLFRRLDALGLVTEFHTLFTPRGWGREAHAAGVAALLTMFAGAQVVTTCETLANPRSRPPRAFGFAPAGEWRESALGPVRAWVLTRAAWETSATYRRHVRCQ